ncbi:MAG: N-acetyl sugar amidotransferase [Rhodospirillales bacterium]|nr:N-acetyl sugar amidotransferase [Rhodospirillales bacterium]
MHYCQRCVYPANARPGLVLDEHGVCSGCRLAESRPSIDWSSREKALRDLLEEYKARQREKGNPYDCIIPVSGGKDSTYQVWLMRERYGMNPLLVSYNHAFNTAIGIRNLTNLVKRMDCNLIRFTTAPGSAIRIARHMLRKVGDVTWHYHAGIMTFPIRTAVQYDVPLIVWGEHGFSELVGMHNYDDFVEFTKKKRQEHDMRGFEPEDILEEGDSGLTRYDLAPFFYPNDEDIERVGIRGIYLSNYMEWDGKKHAEFVIENLGFETAQSRERTFNLYDKLDDIHANGLHDYLKYLKFGYGRATDEASFEIRRGRMTREEGIEMAAKYDAARPSDMDIFLREAGMTEAEFLSSIEHLRDTSIWEKTADGKWRARDSVANHRNDPGVEAVRLPMGENRTSYIRTPSREGARYMTGAVQTDYVIL